LPPSINRNLESDKFFFNKLVSCSQAFLLLCTFVLIWLNTA